MLLRLEDSLVAEATAVFAARLLHSSGGRVTLNCPKEKAAPLADWLIAQGAAHVSVAARTMCFWPKTRFMKD